MIIACKSNAFSAYIKKTFHFFRFLVVYIGNIV